MKFTQTLALAFAFTATVALAQEQRGASKTTVAGKSVAVEYGRPVLAGRDMLGMAKVGAPWRMGAGSPTSLKTEVDLHFGSVALPKGSYELTAVKNEKGDWTVIASDPTTKTKAAELPLVSSTLPSAVEQFTIEVSAKANAGEFAMMWGTAKMATTFTVK